MDNRIVELIDNINLLKNELRKSRKELGNALQETDIYKQVRSANCEVEVDEKDAHKHAINVSLKYYTT